MEFTEDAFVMQARPHGEAGAIIHVLSEFHGLIAAHVAGGHSRRMRPLVQPGARVMFSFRARSEEGLGSATLEPSGPSVRAFDVLDDPQALLALQCACLLTRSVLPEREPQEGVFAGFQVLMAAFDDPHIWPAVYVRYELGLLEALGFGIDLSACAATGVRDSLVYVSPRSGRAVSHAAGAPFRDKLLALPQFLLSSQNPIETGDIGRGLILSGFFLERHLFNPQGKPLPEFRQRLAETFA